jgi:hypothetical protein
MRRAGGTATTLVLRDEEMRVCALAGTTGVVMVMAEPQ